MTSRQLKARLRDAVDAAGGIRAFARLHTINASWVCQALKPETPVFPSVSAAIGYARRACDCPARYKRIA